MYIAATGLGDNANADTDTHPQKQQREDKGKRGWKKIENFASKMKHHLAKDMNILKGDMTKKSANNLTERKSNVIFGGDDIKTAEGSIRPKFLDRLYYNVGVQM